MYICETCVVCKEKPDYSPRTRGIVMEGFKQGSKVQYRGHSIHDHSHRWITTENPRWEDWLEWRTYE